jgi:O-antigen ligase
MQLSYSCVVLPPTVEKRLQNLIVFGGLLATTLVTPWLSLDPINIPKLLVLSIFGFALLGNTIPFLTLLFNKQMRLISVLSFSFISWMLIVLVQGQSSFTSQVFGTYGRNTGLLAYVVLNVFFVVSTLMAERNFYTKLFIAIFASASFNAFYGVIQWRGLDPVDWSNQYNSIVGTLGNPNFVSAFLGISSAIAYALLLDFELKPRFRFLILFVAFISIITILNTNSTQGLLIFAIGALLTTFIRLHLRFNNYFASASMALILAVTFMVALFGVLNIGPLKNILYQSSVTYRGDYWRAGWSMTTNNPLFGVGLDSYGDWYRFYRSEAAALRRGPDITTNSAHNVFIDISSNGGFPLLLIYLTVMGIVLHSALRILRRMHKYDSTGVALIIAWLCYQIQSIISINQLGVAVWGWILSGAIIGYSRNSREPKNAPIRFVSNPKKSANQVPAKLVITGTLGVLTGIMIGVWPLTKDIKFRDAFETGNPERIEKVLSAFPKNSFYYTYAAQVFLDGKLDSKSKILAVASIDINPRDFGAWKVLLANPGLSQQEKSSAILKMRELDPFNNTLKN